MMEQRVSSYRSRLPASPFPMWIFDRNSGAILAANEAAVHAYGYTLEEILRCTVHDLCRLEGSDGNGLLAATRARIAPWTGTLSQRTKDGSWFEADVALIETGDEDLVATVVVRRPELREPPAADSYALRGDGDTFMEIEPRALVERVRERARARADAKDVDIVIHCSSGLVLVQAQPFSEAFYALLTNAIQASRRGHPVVVDVRDANAGGVVFQIQDSGDGTSPRVLAEIGRAPHTPWPGGSRLGVSLASTIIERHGGSLRFESAPGVGTTASIWLPGPRDAA